MKGIFYFIWHPLMYKKENQFDSDMSVVTINGSNLLSVCLKTVMVLYTSGNVVIVYRMKMLNGKINICYIYLSTRYGNPI